MLSPNNRNKLISLLEHKNYQAAGDSFIIFPDNINTMGQIIKLSNRFGIRIVVIGNGTTFDSSFRAEVNTVFLSTQKLNSSVYIDKTDMFAEFQAGCRWRHEFEKLKSEGFGFPIDLESVTEKRTAGGLFSSISPQCSAANCFTGLEFFTADGTHIKYGSKTLKNVVGYDLVRFMAGSMGKFGIVTSVTLRLFPLNDLNHKSVKLSEITFNDKINILKGIARLIKSELDPNGVFV